MRRGLLFIFAGIIFLLSLFCYFAGSIYAGSQVDYWLINNYLYMHKKLINYMDIENAGGWPQINIEETLEKGSKGSSVFNLRERLYLVGDLPLLNERKNHLENDDPYFFDHKLEKAVKRFQFRHGLKVDGIVKSRTLQALNVTVSKRIEQIRLNIEEIEKILKEKNNEFILVNIPEFNLKYIKDNKIKIKMKVIVGKINKQTSVFNGEIEYIVINPYWRIPIEKTITEIIPTAKNDSSYLENKNIHIFDSWDENSVKLKFDDIDWKKINLDNFKLMFRQEPGPENEMGKVKFIFPNDQYIFIHGTPHLYLFDYKNRTFSSGCIRIEKPLELARLILTKERRENINLTSIQLECILSGDKKERIDLEPFLPVYLVYWTSWVDEKGLLHFRNDIYNKHGG